MDKILRTSLKVIEKINYKKYGWVLTTASLVALIFYQRGKDDHDEQKSKKDSNQNEQNSKKQDEKQQVDIKKPQKNDGNRKEDQQASSSKLNLQLNTQNKPTSITSLKEQKMQQIQQNLKKQKIELDKKTKKMSLNSSSSSLLRSSKGKYSNKQFDEEQSNGQNAYAMSDIESRQNLQIRNQINLKNQRKYITDIDEPSNSYKRNKILQIAKDQNPNDGLFFQMLASLAENEEEYE